nr:hypothetical protein GLRG_07793 [uncultured bacterium]
MTGIGTVLTQEDRQLLIYELRWSSHAASIDDHTLVGARGRSALDVRPLARKLTPPHVPLLDND